MTEPTETLDALTRASTGGPAPARVPELSGRIGRYVILRLLGEGGMGRVYAAYDEELDRKIAVKVLRTGVDPRACARVFREAQAMARLRHPSVITVYDVGHHGETVYIAMEYLHGATLSAWQSEESRGWEEVVAAYMEAGRGLAAAHDEGIVHRDFKPQNVMVERRNDGSIRVAVLDFGLALRSGDGDTAVESAPVDSVDIESRLTQAGTVVGTPAYMAPEQHRETTVTAAADQFSFCVALWEGLYRQRPFQGKTPSEVAAAASAGRLASPPSNRLVPGWVHDILVRGLKPSPDDRYPSMWDLLSDLDPTSRKTRGRWAPAVGVLGAAMFGFGVLAWMGDGRAPCSGSAEPIADVWNPSVAAEIRDALRTTRTAYADTTAEAVQGQLTQYADAWAAQHEDACEATNVRHVQSATAMDLRMACLHEAKQSLEAATEVLRSADTDVVKNAQRLIEDLPSLDRCADVAALQSEVDPPRPEDVDTVAAARRELTAARAERNAGRLDPARTHIDAARDLASRVDYGPVEAELDLDDAWLLQEAGEYEAAELAARRALGRAAGNGQHQVMYDAVLAVIFALGDGQRKIDEALRFRELAEGLADTPMRRAGYETTIGALLKLDGKYEQAIAMHRSAVATRESELGPDHSRVLTSLNNLAVALRAHGSLDESIAIQRRILARREATLGDRHPLTALTRRNLANAIEESGGAEEALELTRKALSIFEEAYGAPHPNTVRTRLELARLLRLVGKPDEARVIFERALPELVDALGPDHPDIVLIRSNYAVLLDSMGEHSAAAEMFRTALQGAESSLGASHPNVAMLRLNLAQNLKGRGDVEAAASLLERGREDLVASLGATNPNTILATTALAELRVMQGRAQEAIDLLEQAWTLAEAAPGRGGRNAGTAFELAKILWTHGAGNGVKTRALELAREARRRLRDSDLPESKPKLAAVEAWLASHDVE